MKDVATGLARKGTAEFGKALVKEAQEANRKSLQQNVVGKVTEILMQIEKQSRYMQNCEDNIALLRERLSAIERGEFSLSPYGVISYTDEKLEKAIIGMIECVNCGCNLTKYGHK